MKKIMMMLALAMALGAGAAPVIGEFSARQRYPWNGKVDIGFTLSGVTAADGAPTLKVKCIDREKGITNVAKTVTGDTAFANGRHTVTWDMNAEGHTFVLTNALFVVSYEEVQPLYCVIDLSSGSSSASYPVSYLGDAPSGGWTDEYKTTKLVLRYIEPGTFTMGSPVGEVGRSDNYESQHQVTLTTGFWVGVFEVTQRQWELVMGSKPSYFSNASYYATRPVECVSYDDIRGSSSGAGWPGSSAVDADSFMGRLRARTKLDGFDLPTEAQWEYACRAGTTTALNSGKNLTNTDSDSNMAEVGRYWYNGGSSYDSSVSTSGATAKVGSYAPNDWGLYDMHGNVWEWCLDWWQSSLGTSAVTNPVGAASGSGRSLRGGSWGSSAQYCRSAYRINYGIPSDWNYFLGFRLSRTCAQ